MIEFDRKEKEKGVLAYVEAKLQEVGEIETPCGGNMFSSDELLMLFDLAKDNRTMAVNYALCIGFANGIKYKNKKNKD